ncbi:MAG: DHA2 family efflux MFS transporter permease subunit [Dehalococcoidales bacterium]|nr:DHA2 family efflux MFS transporter permease subunit [Dehalococcoidales bacterium]
MMTRGIKQDERINQRRWWIFAVLALAVLIVVIDHTILNVALPTLQRELGAAMSELQWMIDAYSLAFATLLLTMGTMGDRIGRAKVLRTGMVVFGLASLGAVFASTADHLVTARVFMGVGAAMIMPATLAIIINIFPPDKRGKAIGAWGAMNGVGVALGPLLGGLLLEHFSWSSVFFINIPIVVIAVVAGWFLIPDSRDPKPRQPDIPGTVLSAAALFMLVFGLIKGSDWGWGHAGVIAILAASVAAGLLFILWEKRSAEPMLDLGLFSNPRLSAGSGGIALMTVIMFGTLFALTMYMQFVKGYSALETGIRFLPIAFGYALGSMASNRFVNRLGTKVVVVAGFLGIAIIAPIAAFWQTGTPYLQIGLLLGIFSFFMGSIMAPSISAILGAIPKARSGIGSAVNSVAFQVGGALGIAALGSALSTVYRAEMASALSNVSFLPAEVLKVAEESVGAAVTVAGRLPAAVQFPLIQAAGESFMEGWQVVLLVIICIGVLGAVLILKFMPSRERISEQPEQLSASEYGNDGDVCQHNQKTVL